MNVPTTLTDTKTPREIGREMLRLREQFNLTPQEVAERIHIRPRYITAMEEGRYDQMPGKVYARGYIQTYAEFLGMNVATTIAHCFAGEPLPAAQPVPRPAATRATPASGHRRAPVRLLVGVSIIAALAVWMQWRSLPHQATEPALTTVAPVPEAMLASIRNMVMPTAGNYSCLAVESSLGCFYNDPTTHTLARLLDTTHLPFVGQIDITPWVVAPPEPDAAIVKEIMATAESAPTPADPLPEEAPTALQTPPADEAAPAQVLTQEPVDE